MNEDEMTHFYTNQDENLYDLLINEYLIVRNAEGEIVDRLCWTENGYRHLDYSNFSSKWFGDVKPMKGDVYQAFVADSFTNNKITLVKGPAGSGKTYTAIALAVRSLKNKEIKKIILSRPAVEAGEKLGFLPGDMKDKIDPYLQPLYDALQDMIPAAKLKEFMELNIIQIAPLAFMRGRTLNDAVVILDEAQNTSSAQIKMFLTRMGWNTKMIVTGDRTQIDLPPSQKSGLIEAQRILKDVNGIAFIEMDKRDIVRHKLVTRIVEAYEQESKQQRATEEAEQKGENHAGVASGTAQHGGGSNLGSGAQVSFLGLAQVNGSGVQGHGEFVSVVLGPGCGATSLAGNVGSFCLQNLCAHFSHQRACEGTCDVGAGYENLNAGQNAELGVVGEFQMLSSFNKRYICHNKNFLSGDKNGWMKGGAYCPIFILPV